MPSEKQIEAAMIAGWNACRKSIFAVCEDVGEEVDRLQDGTKPRNSDEAQHAKGYYAGQRYAAKSIARGFNSMEARDDDNLRAALSAAEQHAADDGWQDMSSAPKDGTEFQTWCVQRGYHNDGFWGPRCRHNPISEAFEIWGRIDYDEDGWATYPEVVPTHCRPLPAPPTKGDSNV